MCHSLSSLFLIGLVGLFGRGLLRRLFSGGVFSGSLLGSRLLGRCVRSCVSLGCLLGRSLFSNGFGVLCLDSSLDRRLCAAGQDLGDPDGGKQLTVTVAATRIVATTLLEDDD